jgi:hypothetical protein
MDRTWAVAWGAWLAVFLLDMVFPTSVWTTRALFGIFFILEGWGAALRKRGGDTLSEFQWMISSHAPHSKWWQGWNALVVAFTILISARAAQLIYAVLPSLPVVYASGVAVALWLGYHWLNPRKHH